MWRAEQRSSKADAYRKPSCARPCNSVFFFLLQDLTHLDNCLNFPPDLACAHPAKITRGLANLRPGGLELNWLQSREGPRGESRGPFVPGVLREAPPLEITLQALLLGSRMLLSPPQRLAGDPDTVILPLPAVSLVDSTSSAEPWCFFLLPKYFSWDFLGLAVGQEWMEQMLLFLCS